LECRNIGKPAKPDAQQMRRADNAHLYHCTTMSTRSTFRRAAYGAVALFAIACASDTTAPPAPVAFIGITPTAVLMQVNATRQMTAILRDSAGNNLTGRAVTWESDNPAVATISASGLVTAVSPGYADILATSEGKKTGVGLTVASQE
jgi:uncharacterized protein YjdB